MSRTVRASRDRTNPIVSVLLALLLVMGAASHALAAVPATSEVMAQSGPGAADLGTGGATGAVAGTEDSSGTNDTWGAFFRSWLGPLGFLIIVATGVFCLGFALRALIVRLHGLGLTDPTRALGLPEGSVRAMIALSILIAFVSLVTLILIMTDDATARADLGKQVFVALNTLLASIATFYFTSSSMDRQGATANAIEVVEPADTGAPIVIDRNVTSSLTVRLKTTPADADVGFDSPPEGDATGKIEKGTTAGAFTYTPGQPTKPVVELRFFLMATPAVERRLYVVVV